MISNIHLLFMDVGKSVLHFSKAHVHSAYTDNL